MHVGEGILPELILKMIILDLLVSAEGDSVFFTLKVFEVGCDLVHLIITNRWHQGLVPFMMARLLLPSLLLTDTFHHLADHDCWHRLLSLNPLHELPEKLVMLSMQQFRCLGLVHEGGRRPNNTNIVKAPFLQQKLDILVLIVIVIGIYLSHIAGYGGSGGA